MQKEQTPQEDSQELRYVFSEPLPVSVLLHDGDASALPAQLLDVALGGAKIAIEREVPPQPICLKLGDQAAVEGEIRWCWQSETGPWIAGCSFAPQLPAATFAAIVEGGRIDRLQMSAPAAVALAAQGEISGTHDGISLQNHSTHGLCLRTTNPMVTGERLRLQVDAKDPLLFSARVQWQLELADGYLVGCQLSSGRDRQLLEALNAAAAAQAV